MHALDVAHVIDDPERVVIDDPERVMHFMVNQIAAGLHESGHAIVALALRRGVKEVVLLGTPTATGVGGYMRPYGREPIRVRSSEDVEVRTARAQRRLTRDLITITYAGAIAERFLPARLHAKILQVRTEDSGLLDQQRIQELLPTVVPP